MKLSVIFGVLQMLLGIILKGLNNLYESDYIEFFFVFIPQIILMSILFGYMDLLIIFKWNMNFNNDLSQAPDIKVIMMDIFLNPMGEYNKDYLPLWGNREKIKVFHSLILIISVVCILIMIIPNIIFKKIKSDKNYETNLNKKKKEEEINEQLLMEDKNENIKKSFSDITVGVLINSIEYILGTVSNTASYLRLWALSLAHSQLSNVFFNGTIGLFKSNYFFINGILLSTFGIVAFVIVTSIVLLFMDAMESFLHTLRLHWVEFQNKFFHADGYMFMPFCFTNNLPLNDENV